MSDIPKSRRSKSKCDAEHKALEIRRKIAVELLTSFAYDPAKLEIAIQNRTAYIKDPEQRAKAAEALRGVHKDFAGWYIRRHRDRVDDLCCEICQHLRAANTIWPSYKFEFYDRRNEFNQALKCCNELQDELQYIAETLPTDKNRYLQIVLEVEALFKMVRAMRQAGNRFLKTLKD